MFSRSDNGHKQYVSTRKQSSGKDALTALEPRETALSGKQKVYTVDVRDGSKKWRLTNGSGELVSKLTSTMSSCVWGINVDNCWMFESSSFDKPVNLAIETNAGAFGIIDVTAVRALQEINLLLITTGVATRARHYLVDCETGKVHSISQCSASRYCCSGVANWRGSLSWLLDSRAKRRALACAPNEFYFSTINDLQELIVKEVMQAYGEIERVDYGIAPNDTSRNYLLRVSKNTELEALILLDFLTSPYRKGDWQGMFNRQPCLEMPSVYCLPFWRYIRFSQGGGKDEIGKAIWLNELARDEKHNGIATPLQVLLRAHSNRMGQVIIAITSAVPSVFLDPEAYQKLYKSRIRDLCGETVPSRTANLMAFQKNYADTIRKLALSDAVAPQLRDKILFYADIYDIYENAQFQPRANGTEQDYADVLIPHKDVAIIYGRATTDAARARYKAMSEKFAMRGIWLFEWDINEPRDKASVHARVRKERALRKKWLAEQKVNGQTEATMVVVKLITE